MNMDDWYQDNYEYKYYFDDKKEDKPKKYHKMIMCGLHMEMEMAKELGLIGKCEGCFYFDFDGKNEICTKKGEKTLKEHKDDCEEWLVDMR